MHAIVLFADQQARKADSVRGCLGSTANPPLGRSQGRSVDHELLALFVVGRGSLETLNVAAVSELSHGKAASDLHRLHVVGVLGHLFFGAVAFNSAFEQTVLWYELATSVILFEIEGIKYTYVNTNTSIDARVNQTD